MLLTSPWFPTGLCTAEFTCLVAHVAGGFPAAPSGCGHLKNSEQAAGAMLGVSVHGYYYLISISLLFSVLFSSLLSSHFSFIRRRHREVEGLSGLYTWKGRSEVKLMVSL